MADGTRSAASGGAKLSANGAPKGRGPIVFISTMDGDPWGGSEELWQATALRLGKMGYEVRASVLGWPTPHPKVQELLDAGVDVMFRRRDRPRWRRVLKKLIPHHLDLTILDVERWIKKNPPELIVVNEQFALPPFDYVELFAANRWRYVSVCHANGEHWWPEDEYAERYGRAVAKAETLYYVSENNLKLAIKQSGLDRAKAEIVRNPFGGDYNNPLPWPVMPADERLEMAFVGRLDPRSKAQDIAIEVLSEPQWRDRNWRLNLYGAGRWERVIKRLVRDAGLEDRIIFHGHVSLDQIWRGNHILVQPSRVEGLPITIVEAQVCARPVLTTDIAGNAEFLEEGVSGFIADAPVQKLVSQAFERMWERRADLKAMGQAARASILQHMPEDPAAVFAERLVAKMAALKR